MLNRSLSFLNHIQTAYRRIKYVKGIKGYVIDIGSGNLPNPRANVSCDFIDANSERYGDAKIDRPFVWANVESLPFRNQAFQFSIFSHVLEHMENPRMVLKELERISAGGYIETPSAFIELMSPYTFHLWRCSVRDKKLYIIAKKSWNEELGSEYDDIKADMRRLYQQFNKIDSREFLTTYTWKGKINFEVFGKPSTKKELIAEEGELVRPFWKTILVRLVYILMKPKKIDLNSILVCPRCKGELTFSGGNAKCKACGSTYKKYKGCWDFRIVN